MSVVNPPPDRVQDYPAAQSSHLLPPPPPSAPLLSCFYLIARLDLTSKPDLVLSFPTLFSFSFCSALIPSSSSYLWETLIKLEEDTALTPPSLPLSLSRCPWSEARAVRGGSGSQALRSVPGGRAHHVPGDQRLHPPAALPPHLQLPGHQRTVPTGDQVEDAAGVGAVHSSYGGSKGSSWSGWSFKGFYVTSTAFPLNLEMHKPWLGWLD